MLKTYKDFFEINVQLEKENIRILLSSYGLSKRLFLKYFNERKIFLNEKLIHKGDIVRYGDIIRIYYEEDNDSIIPIKMDLDIVYEDNDLLIVNKKSNQVVHPIKYYKDNTLLNGVKYYFQNQNIKRTPRLVNRLDRDTEGLVIIAKNAYIDSIMSDMIKKNLIDRRYIVLVHGKMKEQFGLINKPILKIENQMKRIISDNGKKSLTKFTVLHSNNRYTLLEVQLLTGRSHQIRVHFSSINHNLVSDDLYGEYEDESMYLCSYHLSFNHPIINDKIEINLKTPIKRFTEKMKN